MVLDLYYVLKYKRLRFSEIITHYGKHWFLGIEVDVTSTKNLGRYFRWKKAYIYGIIVLNLDSTDTQSKRLSYSLDIDDLQRYSLDD